MSLDDIVKVATGSGISFLAGLAWGYTTAYHENKMSDKELRIKELLDFGLMSIWGTWPQTGYHHDSPWMLLAAYVGGIAGAYAGKIVGNKWWHSRRSLSENEKKELDEIKERLRIAGRKKSNEFEEVMTTDYLKYVSKLKKTRTFIEKLNNETKDDVLHYLHCYYSVQNIKDSKLTGGFALRTEKTAQEAGVLYVLEPEHIYKIQVSVERSLVVSRENSPLTGVEICPKIMKEESYKWDGDIAKLTDEILEENRIVCVAGGPGDIDAKKCVAMMNYMHSAAEYLADKQKEKYAEAGIPRSTRNNN